MTEALIRPIVFLEPDRLVHPPSWIEHIPFAFWLIDVLRPRVFVELGTHAGNSYAAFAQAVRHLGLDAAGYAVDTWKGDLQAGFYDEFVFAEWKAYHDRRYSSFSTLVRTTFDDAVNHFPDSGIDLLNIDGYHSAEAVRHDFDTWLPKMSSRGVVLMHDINVRERDFGAWEVWQQLSAVYPSFDFLHGHGLGLLAVGADLPAELRWLVAPGGERAGRPPAVRQFFARTGGDLLARYNEDARLEEAHLAERQRLAGRVEIAQEQQDATAPTPGSGAELADAGEPDPGLDALTRGAAAIAEADSLRERLSVMEGSVAALEEQLTRRDAALRALQTLSMLPAIAQASSTRALAGAAARFRALADTYRGMRTARPLMSRVAATLRALEVLPGQILGRPRRIATLVRFAARPRLFRDAHHIANSELFDASYYLRLAPDLARAGANPLAHFVMIGGAEGRSPCLLFDAAWYLAKYPDVAASRANPLAHYLRTARREDRDPHPLFSAGYYRSQLGVQPAGSIDPLQHYISDGVFEGRSPHPLFDPEYYAEKCGAALSGVDPFAHFLAQGAAGARDPHPLFDVQHYQKQLSRRERSGTNPLRQYLEEGASRNQSPHPLFDPAYYRARNVDVAASGVEPLVHYATIGGREGRQPSPSFDGAWYLKTYPDVAADDGNPLVHYVRHGWLEGRNPSPEFNTRAYLARYADVVRQGVNPLAHYVEQGVLEDRVIGPDPGIEPLTDTFHQERVRLHARSPQEEPSGPRVIVCLTHVAPVAPRAGNEYRIHRMLTWLHRAGYVVIPVLAPNDGSQPGVDMVHMMAAEFNNAIVCLPNGELHYLLRDVPDVLRSLHGELTPPFAAQLGEDRYRPDHEREMLHMDRSFCSDAVMAAVLRLESALGRYVLLAEYIWMSRVLPLASPRALKIIDTIDVFSTRHEKVGQFGVTDLVVEPEAERRRLVRADVMIAIQQNERQALETLVPGMPIVTTGVDFDVLSTQSAATGRRVLLVASDNPMNRHGLRDFLRFAWPRVLAGAPDAELLVVGRVGESLPIPPERVTVLGKIDDLAPLYASCRAVINPAIAGTGVKIKTLEALSHLRRVVAWPNGVDGLSPALAGLCRTAQDWYSFADQLVEVLTIDAAAAFSADERELLMREAAPDLVYGDLGRVIEQFFSGVETLHAQRPS